MWRGAILGAGLLVVFGGCRRPEQESGTPGQARTARTHVLEAGAEVLQRDGPIGAIHARLCGFHFYSGDPSRQVHAEHYCSHLNEEVIQCVIYDSAEAGARLIGIEYVISEHLFMTLPEEEKRLWHSHRHEVSSGLLLAPGLPEAAETALMQKLITTYGKTWHTWQVDRGDALPLGPPQLMMGFTADGQIDPALQEARDREVGVDAADRRRARTSLPTRPVAPGADAWQRGDAPQIPLSLPAAPAKAANRPASGPESSTTKEIP